MNIYRFKKQMTFTCQESDVQEIDRLPNLMCMLILIPAFPSILVLTKYYLVP